MSHRINLGDEARDIVSGFVGVATARTEWINKCVRYGLTPQDLHDGKPVDPQWFDEAQLVVTKPAKVAIPKEHFTGGPAMRTEGGRPADARR